MTCILIEPKLWQTETGKSLRVLFFKVNAAGAQEALDISGATSTRELRYVKPSGTNGAFPLTFVSDGSDGLAEYVLASQADLDEQGAWTVQGLVEGPGPPLMRWFTDKATITVDDPLPGA